MGKVDIFGHCVCSSHFEKSAGSWFEGSGLSWVRSGSSMKVLTKIVAPEWECVCGRVEEAQRVSY